MSRRFTVSFLIGSFLLLGSCGDGPPARHGSAPVASEPSAADRTGPPNSVRLNRAILNPPWERELRRGLARKVSFEFVDEPIEDALLWLQALSLTHIKLDSDQPDIDNVRTTLINLRISNMEMKLSLSWICKLADVDFGIADGAVLVSSPDRMATMLPPATGEEVLGPDDEVASAWKQEIRAKLRKRVSFEFRNRSLKRCVQYVQRRVSCKFVYDPVVFGPPDGNDLKNVLVAMEVEKRPVGECLKWILARAELGFALKDGGILLSSKERLISLRSEMLARQAAIQDGRIEEIVRKRLQRKVSFKFSQMPLRDAVQQLQTASRIVIRLDERAVAGDHVIDLELKHMSVSSMLRWLLRVTGMQAVLAEDAIFISTPQRIERLERLNTPVLPLSSVAPQNMHLAWLERYKDRMNERVTRPFTVTTIGDLICFFRKQTGLSIVRDASIDVTKKLPLPVLIGRVPMQRAWREAVDRARLGCVLVDEAVFMSFASD